MDDHLVSVLEDEDDDLQQLRGGVEPEPQFSIRWPVVTERFDSQRHSAAWTGVLGGDAVFESGRVDLHAAKWASAARMASDLLMSFFGCRRVQGVEFFGGEPECNHLHGLRSAAGAAAAAWFWSPASVSRGRGSLTCSDVLAGLRLRH